MDTPDLATINTQLDDAGARRIAALNELNAASRDLTTGGLIVLARAGGRPQEDIATHTGYSLERIRQLERAAGLQPTRGVRLTPAQVPRRVPVARELRRPQVFAPTFSAPEPGSDGRAA